MNKSVVMKLGAGIAGVIVVALIAMIVVKGRGNESPQATNTPTTNRDQNDSKQATATPTATTSAFLNQYSNCDEDAKPVFSHAPLAVENIGGITPLGQVLDGHVTPTDHMYVSPKNMNAADNSYDVVMPADGKVMAIGRMPAQYIGDRQGQKLAEDDFNITVSFSCRYFSIFIHLHKLSDKLQTAIGELPAGQSKMVDVPLKAGELIAHIGGSSFDWTVLDTTKKLTGFISPELYSGEPWKIHTVSPFDVYSGELKTQLEAKSVRTVAPLAGKIDYDVPGALIGNWFKEGTNGYQGASMDRYYDGHLSIAPNNIDPTAVMYSTGNWSGSAKQFAVKGEFKPETVTSASGVVKIELVDLSFTQANGQAFTGGAAQKGMKVTTATGTVRGTVLLQVMVGEKLKLEQFPGKKASDVTAFTSAALTYER